MRRDDVTAVILGGGRATRMGGVDKRELVVEGRTIFARQCEVLEPRVTEIVVSLAPGAPAVTGHRCVTDAVADAGPLAGIAAALAAVSTPWLLVIAGDMPYISPALISRLLDEASEAADAVGVRVGGLPEPLVCLLRVGPARGAVERMLAERRFKASGLLTDEHLRVAWIDDVDLRALVNVNAPADLGSR